MPQQPRRRHGAAAQTPATTIVHCAGAIRERPIENVSLADLEELGNLHLGARCRWFRRTYPR